MHGKGSPISPIVQVETTPMAATTQHADVLFNMQLELGCTQPGRYRLCLLGQGPGVSYGQAAQAEDSGFAIDVLA